METDVLVIIFLSVIIFLLIINWVESIMAVRYLKGLREEQNLLESVIDFGEPVSSLP